MKTENVFTVTEEIHSLLNDAAKQFVALEMKGFDAEMEKGRIVHDALKVLGDGKGPKGAWKRWLQNDLRISKRTGQNYRDIYRFFSPQSNDCLAALSSDYLKAVGVSLLVEFLPLKKKISKKTYQGSVKAEVSPDCIMITFQNGEGADVTKNLKEFTVSGLKALLPKNAKRKIKTGDHDLDSYFEDYKDVDDPKILHTAMAKLLEKAYSLRDKRDELQAELDKLRADSPKPDIIPAVATDALQVPLQNAA